MAAGIIASAAAPTPVSAQNLPQDWALWPNGAGRTISFSFIFGQGGEVHGSPLAAVAIERTIQTCRR